MGAIGKIINGKYKQFANDKAGTGSINIFIGTKTDLDVALESGTILDKTIVFLKNSSGSVDAEYDPILANNTWEKISEASQAGFAKEYWNIGDTKDGNTIVDFDHDDLADLSGKAGITFMSPAQDKVAWDTSGSSDFIYYDKATICTQVLPEKKAALPTELRNVIKKVSKHIATGTPTDVTGSKIIEADLFIASGPELYRMFSVPYNEGECYAGFKEEIVPFAFTWTRTFRWSSYDNPDTNDIYALVSYLTNGKYEYDYVAVSPSKENTYEYFFCI